VRTIAIVNQKGGCGKTTTAINLAADWARRGLRTLLVDMDPQSHCAAGLGVPEERIEFSIGDALRANAPERIDPARLVWPVSRNLFLAPSTVRLAALEAPGGGLHTLADRDRRLERLLERCSSEFDRCLIDCPPTIGLLTFNALRAARHVLIPVETSYFALKGAQRQWETVRRVGEHLGRPLRCTFLPTMHRDAVLAEEVLGALRDRYGDRVAPVVIRIDEALRQAASMGQPVSEFAPDSIGCRDHEALADWLESIEDAGGGPPIVEVLTGREESGAPHVVGMRPPAARQGDPSPSRDRPDQAAHADSAEPGSPDPGPLGEPVSSLPRGPATRPGSMAVRGTGIRSLVAEGAASGTVRREGSRAAELAGRLRTLGVTSILPDDGASEADDHFDDDERDRAASEAAAAFGVHVSGTSVRFLQPEAEPGTGGGQHEEGVSVAGDFNGWSATALPMHRDPDVPGALSARVTLPPGRYQYRIVRGGRWQADPHHPQRFINAFGEANSVFTISPLSAEPI